MNANEAQHFEHKSTKHAAILMQAAADRGCACKPYKDWFTYARWSAQGYQVQKGEKGVHLVTFQKREVVDEKTGEKKVFTRPWHSYVFCRCQVKERRVKE